MNLALPRLGLHNFQLVNCVLISSPILVINSDPTEDKEFVSRTTNIAVQSYYPNLASLLFQLTTLELN